MKEWIIYFVHSRVASVDVILVIKYAECEDAGELHKSEDEGQAVLSTSVEMDLNVLNQVWVILIFIALIIFLVLLFLVFV